jgi:hypothetical protein
VSFNVFPPMPIPIPVARAPIPGVLNVRGDSVLCLAKAGGPARAHALPDEGVAVSFSRLAVLYFTKWINTT